MKKKKLVKLTCKKCGCDFTQDSQKFNADGTWRKNCQECTISELVYSIEYLTSQINLSKLNIKKDFSLINGHAGALNSVYYAKFVN